MMTSDGCYALLSNKLEKVVKWGLLLIFSVI